MLDNPSLGCFIQSDSKRGWAGMHIQHTRSVQLESDLRVI